MTKAKCQKERTHPMFTVETDLQDTERVCCIGPETTGTKEVTVTNYKGYPIYIDLHLQSLNGCLEFLDSGKTEYHVARKVLPPAERGNPTRKTFALQVSQYAEALDAEDSIRVNLTYYDREDALEESKNDSIPEVFPEVELV
ncbi:hypothetical protein [Haloarcula japonica]|uniref:Uncharacterized protein n=3 Tax=Haloarcula TaxID=2237 RepID=A0A830F697_9EURY|nr:hypothetical protein [Haloarcula japonica]GGK79713.1 hypothetical protein GCM10009067_35050 [Haloarcula sebkhae]